MANSQIKEKEYEDFDAPKELLDLVYNCIKTSYHEGYEDGHKAGLKDGKESAEHERVQLKESLKMDTPAGLLIAESYDDGFAKGAKISVNGEIVALIDVIDDGEIRLLGYKEQCDEPSICYSVNR